MAGCTDCSVYVWPVDLAVDDLEWRRLKRKARASFNTFVVKHGVGKTITVGNTKNLLDRLVESTVLRSVSQNTFEAKLRSAKTDAERISEQQFIQIIQAIYKGQKDHS